MVTFMDYLFILYLMGTGEVIQKIGFVTKQQSVRRFGLSQSGWHQIIQ